MKTADEFDRLLRDKQILEDRLNAWEIWFNDVREAVGIGETEYYATAESTRDTLNAIRDLKWRVTGEVSS